MGCVNGAPLDLVLLDGIFTCNCDGMYSDLNCITAVPVSLYQFENNLVDSISGLSGGCSYPYCPTYGPGIQVCGDRDLALHPCIYVTTQGDGVYFSGQEYAQLPGQFIPTLDFKSFTFTIWAQLYAYPATDATLIGSTTSGAYTPDNELHCVSKS